MIHDIFIDLLTVSIVLSAAYTLEAGYYIFRHEYNR